MSTTQCSSLLISLDYVRARNVTTAFYEQTRNNTNLGARNTKETQFVRTTNIKNLMHTEVTFALC